MGEFDIQQKVSKIEGKIDIIMGYFGEAIPAISKNLQELSKTQHELVSQSQYSHETFKRIFKKVEEVEDSLKTHPLLEQKVRDLEAKLHEVETRTRYYPIYETGAKALVGTILAAVLIGGIWAYTQATIHWADEKKQDTTKN